MDVLDSGRDLAKDPKFTEAVARKVYYGPVYFRRESEPYMTLALAGTRKDAGVSIAEVNLKLIWDVVSQIKVGERGHAYVVGAQGRLIAHPDISLVLRNTDMSRLQQVQAAQGGNAGAGADPLQGALNIQGQQVLTASAPIDFKISDVKLLLGYELQMQEVIEGLDGLGFTVEPLAGGVLRIAAPAWRTDVTSSADVIEEIARMAGYDRISCEIPAVRAHTIESGDYRRGAATRGRLSSFMAAVAGSG